MALEELGLPTVTLATSPFLGAARTAARARSLADLPIVEIPHDYLFESEAAIERQVREILPQLIAGLFDAGGAPSA